MLKVSKVNEKRMTGSEYKMQEKMLANNVTNKLTIKRKSATKESQAEYMQKSEKRL